MKRCLIMGCSEAKIDTPDLVPALERYDGPPFRVLRRFLKNEAAAQPDDELDIFVLSAEFGLISSKQPIPWYDRRMTPSRAEALRPQVLEVFQRQIAGQAYAELFLSMGQTYLLALTGYETLLSPVTRVTVSTATAGRKLTGLKAWLTGEEPASQPQMAQKDQPRRRTNQPVNLRGVELALSPEQVLAQARQFLAAAPGPAYRAKNWYVLIDEVKVAPKWLVSQLSGVPVSRFDAGEARRVLEALGVEVHQVNR